MRVEPVLHVLASNAVPYALIGGHAMAARGYPRFTVDVDLLTTDERVLSPAMWVGLAREGATVEPRRGDADDPLAGVVHILLADGTDVDVVVGRWKWEAQLIDRSEPMTLDGSIVRVPRVSDLVLLKLAAGGYADLQDAAALLELGDAEAVRRDVEAHIDEVLPDVRALWTKLWAGRQR